jgi:hypothetical protein
VGMCAVMMRVELEAIAKVQTRFRGLALGGESGGGGRPMGLRGDLLQGQRTWCPERRCRAKLNSKKISLRYIC